MTYKTKKNSGQNFLVDQNIINNIVKKINIQPDDDVVEIGPGLGAISKPIIEITKKLTVIEIDKDVIPALQDTCSKFGDLHIYNEDILKFDFNKLNFDKKARIIGNLPYNISSPILFSLINHRAKFKDMHFMLQKELAQRIASKPDCKSYGRLSVMLQYHFNCKTVLDVPSSAFKPVPKVESAIIILIPIENKTIKADNESHFADVVKQAFSQRRKMLRNTLKSLIDSNPDKCSPPINLLSRAENLSVDDFVRLSNYYSAQA